jgi:hypothetical protein
MKEQNSKATFIQDQGFRFIEPQKVNCKNITEQFFLEILVYSDEILLS